VPNHEQQFTRSNTVHEDCFSNVFVCSERCSFESVSNPLDRSGKIGATQSAFVGTVSQLTFLVFCAEEGVLIGNENRTIRQG